MTGRRWLAAGALLAAATALVLSVLALIQVLALCSVATDLLEIVSLTQ